MRRAVWFSDALRAAVVIAGVLLILTVWPFRLWQVPVSEEGGGVRMEVSAQIDDAHDLIQDFIAQHERLEAVEVYPQDFVSGRYVDLSVFDDRMVEIFHKYADLGEEDLPGRVRIPLGLDLEIGREYRLFFTGVYSGYRFGLQNIPAKGASPYFTKFYQVDTETPEWRLDMKLDYKRPLGPRGILALIAAIAAVTLLLERTVYVIARRLGRERDKVVTVAGACSRILAPVFYAGLTVLAVLVLAGRFDHRVTDNVFYLAGLIIAGLLGALFFFTEAPAAGGREKEAVSLPVRLCEAAQTVLFALAIGAACRYMNGLYDAEHLIAARWEAGYLSAFFLLFLIGGGKGKKRGGARPSFFGILALVFFVLLIVFRNTRLWGAALAGLFAEGVLCYYFSKRRERFLPLLTEGLILHFAVSMGYCLMRRYFVAFVSARFPFIFHTVTVTAEYLTMMASVSFALLFAAVCRQPRGTGILRLVVAVRREALLFGLIASYVLFTLSRTGILAVAVSVPLLLAVMGIRGMGRKRKRETCGFAAGLAVTVCSLIVCFPAAFTMQRMLPVIAGHPVFMEIEDIDPNLRGAVNWDSSFLISIERFYMVFREKMFAIEGANYDHPEDRYNYDAAGNPVYPRITGAGQATASAGQEAAGGSQGTVEDAGEEAGQESTTEKLANGRFTIWRSYLPYLNLTGHEEMGVPLPDGEITTHAHNTALQISHDHGLITGAVFGLLLVAAMIAGSLYGRRAEQDTGSDGICYVPVALTAGFAVAGLTEWVFHLGNMMTIAMVTAWIPLCFGGTAGVKKA